MKFCNDEEYVKLLSDEFGIPPVVKDDLQAEQSSLMNKRTSLMNVKMSNTNAVSLLEGVPVDTEALVKSKSYTDRLHVGPRWTMVEGGWAAGLRDIKTENIEDIAEDAPQEEMVSKPFFRNAGVRWTVYNGGNLFAGDDDPDTTVQHPTKQYLRLYKPLLSSKDDDTKQQRPSSTPGVRTSRNSQNNKTSEHRHFRFEPRCMMDYFSNQKFSFFPSVVLSHDRFENLLTLRLLRFLTYRNLVPWERVRLSPQIGDIVDVYIPKEKLLAGLLLVKQEEEDEKRFADGKANMLFQDPVLAARMTRRRSLLGLNDENDTSEKNSNNTTVYESLFSKGTALTTGMFSDARNFLSMRTAGTGAQSSLERTEEEGSEDDGDSSDSSDESSSSTDSEDEGERSTRAVLENVHANNPSNHWKSLLVSAARGAKIERSSSVKSGKISLRSRRSRSRRGPNVRRRGQGPTSRTPHRGEFDRSRDTAGTSTVSSVSRTTSTAAESTATTVSPRKKRKRKRNKRSRENMTKQHFAMHRGLLEDLLSDDFFMDSGGRLQVVNALPLLKGPNLSPAEANKKRQTKVMINQHMENEQLQHEENKSKSSIELLHMNLSEKTLDHAFACRERYLAEPTAPLPGMAATTNRRVGGRSTTTTSTAATTRRRPSLLGTSDTHGSPSSAYHASVAPGLRKRSLFLESFASPTSEYSTLRRRTLTDSPTTPSSYANRTRRRSTFRGGDGNTQTDDGNSQSNEEMIRRQIYSHKKVTVKWPKGMFQTGEKSAGRYTTSLQQAENADASEDNKKGFWIPARIIGRTNDKLGYKVSIDEFSAAAASGTDFSGTDYSGRSTVPSAKTDKNSHLTAPSDASTIFPRQQSDGIFPRKESELTIPSPSARGDGNRQRQMMAGGTNRLQIPKATSGIGAAKDVRDNEISVSLASTTMATARLQQDRALTVAKTNGQFGSDIRPPINNAASRGQPPEDARNFSAGSQYSVLKAVLGQQSDGSHNAAMPEIDRENTNVPSIVLPEMRGPHRTSSFQNDDFWDLPSPFFADDVVLFLEDSESASGSVARGRTQLTRSLDPLSGRGQSVSDRGTDSHASRSPSPGLRTEEHEHKSEIKRMPIRPSMDGPGSLILSLVEKNAVLSQPHVREERVELLIRQEQPPDSSRQENLEILEPTAQPAKDNSTQPASLPLSPIKIQKPQKPTAFFLSRNPDRSVVASSPRMPPPQPRGVKRYGRGASTSVRTGVTTRREAAMFAAYEAGIIVDERAVDTVVEDQIIRHLTKSQMQSAADLNQGTSNLLPRKVNNSNLLPVLPATQNQRFATSNASIHPPVMSSQQGPLTLNPSNLLPTHIAKNASLTTSTSAIEAEDPYFPPTYTTTATVRFQSAASYRGSEESSVVSRRTSTGQEAHGNILVDDNFYGRGATMSTKNTVQKSTASEHDGVNSSMIVYDAPQEPEIEFSEPLTLIVRNIRVRPRFQIRDEVVALLNAGETRGQLWVKCEILAIGVRARMRWQSLEQKYMDQVSEKLRRSHHNKGGVSKNIPIQDANQEISMRTTSGNKPKRSSHPFGFVDSHFGFIKTVSTGMVSTVRKKLIGFMQSFLDLICFGGRGAERSADDERSDAARMRLNILEASGEEVQDTGRSRVVQSEGQEMGLVYSRPSNSILKTPVEHTHQHQRLLVPQKQSQASSLLQKPSVRSIPNSSSHAGAESYSGGQRTHATARTSNVTTGTRTNVTGFSGTRTTATKQSDVGDPYAWVYPLQNSNVMKLERDVYGARTRELFAKSATYTARKRPSGGSTKEREDKPNTLSQRTPRKTPPSTNIQVESSYSTPRPQDVVPKRMSISPLIPEERRASDIAEGLFGEDLLVRVISDDLLNLSALGNLSADKSSRGFQEDSSYQNGGIAQNGGMISAGPSQRPSAPQSTNNFLHKSFNFMQKSLNFLTHTTSPATTRNANKNIAHSTASGLHTRNFHVYPPGMEILIPSGNFVVKADRWEDSKRL